ncbi:MAG: phosphoglycolate phosphatase [Rhodospirillales bacterium]|nr:phosphoglycolate phosphatase [Rhodospirillales bacterium]
MGRTILFDLDGTLVDTVPDLAASLNRSLGAAGLAPFAPEEVAGMVGAGMATLLARALAARGRAPDSALLARFHADYLAAVAGASRPFPDVAETLVALEEVGWRMAICTNKAELAARKLLQALGLENFFVALGGGDSFAVKKPDPGHLLASLAAAGGEPARAVMIGDHANDVAAARAAGVVSVFVLLGYGRAEMAHGTETIMNIKELQNLLESLVPAQPAERGNAP